MDPKQRMMELLEALDDRDSEEAADAMDDLREWVDKDGAVPEMDEAMWHKLLIVLGRVSDRSL